MQAILDVRESALLEAWDRAVIPGVETAALDIGDVQFRDAATGDLRFVFERKTGADWLASIRDGRYAEQKARLLANRGGARIVYLLENCVFNEKWQFTAMAEMQAAGITVIPTRNVSATFQALERFWTKAPEWDAAAAGAGAGAPELFPTACAARKKDNYTSQAIWRSQLACIPGVSLAISDVLVEIYPTPRALMDASEDELADVLLSEKRRLGPAVAGRIAAFFSAAT